MKEMDYTPDAIAWLAHWAVADNAVAIVSDDLFDKLTLQAYDYFCVCVCAECKAQGRVAFWQWGYTPADGGDSVCVDSIDAPVWQNAIGRNDVDTLQLLVAHYAATTN